MQIPRLSGKSHEYKIILTVLLNEVIERFHTVNSSQMRQIYRLGKQNGPLDQS